MKQIDPLAELRQSKGYCMNEENLVNKIMNWHYEVCSVNFGADGYVQDATDVIKIAKDTLGKQQKEYEDRIMAIEIVHQEEILKLLDK